MSVPYSNIDPEIRKVVKWLNDRGFRTVAAYDGTTRFEGCDKAEIIDLEIEGVPDFPMVAIQVSDHALLVSETVRLYEHIEYVEGEVFPFLEGQAPEMAIRAQFDPTDGRAIILLVGLTDDMLDPFRTMEDPA